MLPVHVPAALPPPRQRPARALAKPGTRLRQKPRNTPAQHPTPVAESRTPKTSYQPPTTTAGSFRRRVLISVTQRTTDHDMLAVGNACDARSRYDTLRCAGTRTWHPTHSAPATTIHALLPSTPATLYAPGTRALRATPSAPTPTSFLFLTDFHPLVVLSIPCRLCFAVHSVTASLL